MAVALDLSRELGSGPGSSLEDSIRLAASLVRWALDASYPVYLLAPGAPHHPLSWYQAMDFLARAGVSTTPTFPDQLSLCPESAELIILSPDVDRRTGEVLTAARRAGSTVVVALAGYGGSPAPLDAAWPSNTNTVICRPGDDLGQVGARALLALQGAAR